MYIKLIANAGIEINHKKTAILVDAIHNEKSEYFSTLSKESIERLLSGNMKSDYIFITHYHSDHYNEDLLCKYLENNKIKKIFLSYQYYEKQEKLRKLLEEKNINKIVMNIPFGSVFEQKLEENIAIKFFKTRHMGEKYKHIDNICPIFEIENKNILVISDADYDKKFFYNINVDAALVTPLFFNSDKGRDILLNIIKAEKIIIYHIPFERDDKGRFRYIALKDKEKYEKLFENVELLSEENQIIVI